MAESRKKTAKLEWVKDPVHDQLVALGVDGQYALQMNDDQVSMLSFNRVHLNSCSSGSHKFNIAFAEKHHDYRRRGLQLPCKLYSIKPLPWRPASGKQAQTALGLFGAYWAWDDGKLSGVMIGDYESQHAAKDAAQAHHESLLSLRYLDHERAKE